MEVTVARSRKSASTIANDFQAGINRGPAKYIAGVTSGVDWAGAATAPAAVTRRNTGLQAAIADGSIDDGIRAAGNTKWSQNAKVKGGANWQPQALASVTKFQAAMTQVESYWSAADVAANQAGDGSTQASRFARATAFSKSVSDQARAAKGLPPKA